MISKLEVVLLSEATMPANFSTVSLTSFDMLPVIVFSRSHVLVMFSTAAHVTPFFLMEIIVQQSTVYVRTGIRKTIMLVR